MDESRSDAGTGCTEWVADCDSAAADIDLRFVHFEHADAGNRLGGKGFIKLDQIDVLQREASPRKCFLCGGNWAGPHHRRIDSRHSRRADFDEWFKAERLRSFLAHHQ